MTGLAPPGRRRIWGACWRSLPWGVVRKLSARSPHGRPHRPPNRHRYSAPAARRVLLLRGGGRRLLLMRQPPTTAMPTSATSQRTSAIAWHLLSFPATASAEGRARAHFNGAPSLCLCLAQAGSCQARQLHLNPLYLACTLSTAASFPSPWQTAQVSTPAGVVFSWACATVSGVS